MAKYKVIEGFYDLQDPVGRNDFYLYNKGDEYPRDGMEPAPERVASLLSASNNRGNPLIEEIPETIPEEVPDEKAEEIPEEAPEEPAKKQKKRRQKAAE